MTRDELLKEIEDTEKRDPDQSVAVNISMPRSLYLHLLRAVRDGDYGGHPSTYIQALIRRDKHPDPPSVTK